MPGGGQAEDGGCGSLRNGGRAGVVYRGASRIDDRKGVVGGLRKADRGSLAFGSPGYRSCWGDELGSGICECAKGPGIRGRLSTKREGIGAIGRRNGDRGGEIYRSSGGVCEKSKYFVGVGGCGMRCWRRGVEGAREPRGKS